MPIAPGYRQLQSTNTERPIAYGYEMCDGAPRMEARNGAVYELILHLLHANVTWRTLAPDNQQLGDERACKGALMRRTAFVAALALWATVSIAFGAARPVVVIPGIMGSRLCDQAGNTIWGDRASYTANRLAALRLPFDIETRDRGIHSCGLIETVSMIPLLWESNVYTELLKTLRQFGYQHDEIILFHYDWRLSNFDNAAKLRDEITKRVSDPAKKVDIVAHSMGGIVARIYIQALAGENRVQNLIMLGTPHRGSAKIFARLRDGFERWPNVLSGGLQEIQRTILSFPTTYQLLPTYDECCGFSASADPAGAMYVNILSPDTWSRFKWLPPEFRSGIGLQFLSNALVEADRLKHLLAQPIFRDVTASSRLHFTANGFVETWSRVFFNPETGSISGHTSFKGDGTVLLFSATNGDPAHVQISLREHELVFAGREPELVLTAALSGVRWHSERTGLSQRLLDAHNNSIEVHAMSLELEPRLVVPGGNVVANITLKGGRTLQAARLSNLSAQILRDDVVIDTQSMTERNPAPDSRVLQAQLQAPSSPGPYVIRVNVPGLETIDSIFGVIEP